MWKRDNEVPPAAPPAHSPAPSAPVGPVRRDSESARQPGLKDAAATRAVVGAATVVRGELTGEENLLIEGRFEGKIDLRRNAVTVGAAGHVAAEVHASVIVVEGEVEGNLVAEEEIVIRRSGRVRGDLLAPRITIEDGARFKGSVDMDAKPAAAPVPLPTSTPDDTAHGDLLADPFAASASVDR